MSAPEVVCVCTAVLFGRFIPQGSLRAQCLGDIQADH